MRADFYTCMAADTIRPYFESTIRTRAGALRTIRWSSIVERDDDGAATGIVTIGEDVTEHRQAEGELRRREEHFRSLIEHAADIITILELDGTIRYESPSAERALGWKPEELIGRNAFELVHPDDLSGAARPSERNRRRQGAALRFRFTCADGSWRIARGRRRGARGRNGPSS